MSRCGRLYGYAGVCRRLERHHGNHGPRLTLLERLVLALAPRERVG